MIESTRSAVERLLADGKSHREIARELDISNGTVSHHASFLKVQRGAPALLHPVPDAHQVKGVSTLLDKDGVIKQQWIKTNVEERREELAKQAALEAMMELLPRLEPLPGPVNTQAKLANLYTLTDCHIGLLAWAKETGEPWDIRIAEDTLVQTFEQMIMNSPSAQTGIINQLGDFLHTDGLLPVTPQHAHVLDADSRYSKMVQVAIRVLRKIVDRALQKHEHVRVLIAEGNHDMSGSVWLRHLFAALYENEPRISVLMHENPYYAMQFGQTMLAYHHGHMVKLDQLPGIMATMYPKIWGATTHRYVHVGHRHHVDEKEMNGMKIMQHPTMAAKDAYAIRGGWLAQRQATCVTYSSEHGEVARTLVKPEMLT